MSIVHEYKAKGPFTTTLLGIVSLDDALALIFYSFAIVIAKGFLFDGELLWHVVILKPLFSIFSSLLMGLLMGLFLRRALAFFSSREILFGIMAGAILFTSGVALTFGFSPLLANMMLGFMVVNFVSHERSDEVFDVIDGIEEPIFGIFFLIGGAQLNFTLSWSSVFLALLLLFARFIGKFSGSYLGARMSGSRACIRRYMGLSLLPTAGVTVGLALEASTIISIEHAKLAAIMVNAVIGATVINEFVTPFLVRFSLKRAEEITENI